MKKFIKYNISFEAVEERENYSKFSIKPLEKGFGNTIGNSLRRVLLGNIFGTSLFAIKIPGITHEFQAIKGVKEDVTQIILNLKKLVIKYKGDILGNCLDGYKLENWPTLKINKIGGKITAADIVCPSEFEIINKDLYIATLDDKTKFEMELYAKNGKGFISFEENKELVNALGIIAVDSYFSPIIKVGYSVDEIKTSKSDVSDALELEIATNGSISPTDAISMASKILINHYTPLAEINEVINNHEFIEEEKKQDDSTLLSIPIEELDLSVRSYNCLKRQGIETIHQIIDRNRADVEKIRNLGKKSFKEILQKIDERNLKFKDER